jgi:hypothetical protein
MRLLLVAAVVALGAGPGIGGGAGGPEGKWLIVYAEQGGRRNNAWEQRVAVIKGDVLSYEAEEKERSMQLSFGPNQTLTAKVSEEGKGAKTHKGVYIAGQDYLCISLVTGDGKAKGAGAGEGSRSSGDFIVILRRQRAAK